MKARRVLVTGSRDWPAVYELIIGMALGVELSIAAKNGQDLILIHGARPQGVDHYVDKWGSFVQQNGEGLTIERHPAQWWELGRSAGFIRNNEMVRLGADHCLAFIHNGSKGATHCAERAAQAGIETVRFAIDLLTYEIVE